MKILKRNLKTLIEYEGLKWFEKNMPSSLGIDGRTWAGGRREGRDRSSTWHLSPSSCKAPKPRPAGSVEMPLSFLAFFFIKATSPLSFLFTSNKEV